MSNDAVQDGTIVGSYQILEGTVSQGGTGESCRDGDWDTAYNCTYNTGYEGSDCNTNITVTAEWTTPRTITQIDYRIKATSGDGRASGYVQLKISGSWTTVGSVSNSDTGHVTTTTGWAVVTGMKAYCTSMCNGDVPNGQAQIYELQAWYEASSGGARSYSIIL